VDAQRSCVMPAKKKRVSAKRLKELSEKIAVQRRRAARPTLPVNTQARVSESLVERKRRLENKRKQRRDWENL
jgi:hypothetical protein